MNRQSFFLLLGHLLFWGLSYLVLLNHFAISSSLQPIDYLYAGLFHLPLILAVYLNLGWLMPVFFAKKRYFWYVQGLFFNSAIYWLVQQGVFEWLAPRLFSDYYIIAYADPWLALLYYWGYIILTSLLQLSRSWFRLLEAEKRANLLEKEKYQAELTALKAQINPHFLFNALNSLYALSLRKAEEVPEVTLKLSEVLRYMIYDAREGTVPLEKEVHYLRSYLDLQKLRLRPHTELRFSVTGQPKAYRIAPLLFVMLVENAFKHGAQAASERPYVHIQLTVKDGKIHFVVENSKGQTDSPAPKASGGLGLENLQRRLQLLYPKRHRLTIDEQEAHFRAELEVWD
jgi:hypothetical protein